jgi:hypothetical protein
MRVFPTTTTTTAATTITTNSEELIDRMIPVASSSNEMVTRDTLKYVSTLDSTSSDPKRVF